MEKTYSLNTELYLIPYPEKGIDSFIAYFPLQSLVFEINQDASEILERLKIEPYTTSNRDIKSFLDDLVVLKLLNNTREPIPFVPYKDLPEPTYTLLLLTNTCQLKCIYCYGEARKKGTMMPMNIAKRAIDTILKNSIEQRTGMIHVGYHGGGEPTLNWKVLTESYNYALEKCRENKFQLHSSICTNGIISKNQAGWIIDNIQDVAISMDGPPAIQNKQRPMQNGKDSFEAMASTIDYFNKRKKVYNIRLTATEFSHGRLYEIIEYVMNRFEPPVICIEPLYVCGRCEKSGCKPPPLEDFINEMLDVYRLGRKRNIPIQYSGNRLANIMSRFCGAQGSNFFVTPTGYVTACLEVTEITDPKADWLIYGKFDPEKNDFDFSSEKYKRLAASQVHSFKTCDDCFAKWHCAGDCIAKAPDLSKVTTVRNDYRCRLNKTLLRDSLIETMNNQIGLYKEKLLSEPAIIVPQK
jgi:uncharacterized protein